MSIYRLNQVFAPRTVAVVGVGPRPNSVGAAVLRNIRSAGFAGRVGVVEPEQSVVEGYETVASCGDLPFVPDLVVIASTQPDRVPDIVAEAAARGAAGAVILSADLGHGSGSLADLAGSAAHRHGMRLIGPNCLGVLMPAARLNASFAAHSPRRGNLALISQSGALAAGMVDWAAQRPVGFSGIVSVGDQLDVDIADCLDFFAVDPETRAILLYLEAVKDARKFMSAARAAARVKPIVVVKSGRFAHGARAAATHTGSLAGSDAVYDAAFRRAGMLRVFDLRELFDCAETLGRARSPAGKRLAILTNSGGIGALAIDRLEELGGIPAAVGPALQERLNTILPPRWSHANPIDIGGDADAERYAAALQVLLSDPDNDAVLVVNVPTAVASSTEIAETVAQIVREDHKKRALVPKAAIAAWIGGDEAASKTFDAAAMPTYHTEDDAVRGFMHLVHHREVVETLAEVPPSLPREFAPDQAGARAIVTAALRERRKWLTPVEVRRLLNAYQINMVPTFAAADADAAVTAAEPILAAGETVVLKVQSRDIPHKSDVGGVVLNLTSAEAVRAATAEILGRARARRPEAELAGVVVQPMVVRSKARELILGIADDPTFGAIIVFGRGGTAVDVINDKALALPPLDLKLARELIEQTRVARRLRAYRDVPAVKIDDVALTLVKLAQLAADLPEIRELDINPLLADEKGVLAVDARVMIGPATARFAGAGNANFAVRPYPAQWERVLAMKGGQRVIARPIRPDDEPRILRMLKDVTMEDLRLRFFAPIKEFTHQFIARLTQLDYARAMAFVALDEAGEVLGVARLHSDSLYETGEYAILLRSNLKGRGLGWALMQLLIEYARAEGLRQINGQVLQENTAMLAMCRDLGFDVRTDPVEPEICDVALDLRKTAA